MDAFKKYPPRSTLLEKRSLFGDGFEKYPPRSTLLEKMSFFGDGFEKIPTPEHLACGYWDHNQPSKQVVIGTIISQASKWLLGP